MAAKSSVPRRPRRRPASRQAAGRLTRLLASRLEYGAGAAELKLALLAGLARARLPTAAAVLALHEHLLFVRAYPDDPRVLAAAEAMLAAFARRADLARQRDALADTGIAGTAIAYPFFHVTARWLARRHPGRLRLDREGFGAEDLGPLRALLLEVLRPEEAVWVREWLPDPRAALAELAGPGRTDAEFLLERLAAAPGDDFLREARHDAVAPYYVLAPGPATPARTTARAPGAPPAFRSAPPRGARPDLAAELGRPPRAVRAVGGAEAERLVALAREAMVTRARDLDCFCFGDPRDVRRIVDRDGLEFVAIGSLPERRLLVSAAYGLLTLRNGVPIGYVQLDGFLATALVHFNTFETFRGADAAWVFARALAAARRLFGADAFAIEPYQLGAGNDEALDSGAWWFYAKLGFAPRDPALIALARRERARLARRAGRRTPRATLLELAQGHLFWEPAGRRATVPPHAELSRALAVASAAAAADGDPDGARSVSRAAAALGLDRRRTSAAERLWLARWAPLLGALPGFAGWSADERAAAAAVLRAKAGRRESAMVPRLRAHPRFGPALLELAARFARGAGAG